MKNYGNLLINIFWRILLISLLFIGVCITCVSISKEHYTVIPGSIEYKVTKNNLHFKNFTLEDYYGKTYKLEGKVDKNGRIIYFVNGEKMKLQSKMQKYIKNDRLTYCGSSQCKGHSNNRYGFIKDNHIFCYYENGFYVFIRLLFLVLCGISFIGLIFGIIRNIEFYRGCNNYDWKVIRRYDNEDYLTPLGLYIDSLVCKYNLKQYIKRFFGYD